ncbi:hypothetical protein [Microbacterium sp. 10M-3C3]|uniref:hypothetical protein n=1 Tax=Microbacterium sp. 10M-3C3 TaxID=2483401 RepID=UPI000F62EFEE|nr:hypothetical protein [Microbacterium sp. 10M-3C3]
MSAPSDRSATIRLPLRPARAPRIVRLAQLWLADVLRAPRGVVPIVRRDFTSVLTLWVVARAVNFTILWGFYVISKAAKWGFGSDDQHVKTFLDWLTGWDADRYLTISQFGYPDRLPVNQFGDILPNNWAFLPVFPYLTRFVHDVTGLSDQFVAVALATLASLGATWMLFVLLRRVTNPRAAWWGTTFFSFAPLSFVYVLGYSEGLALFLTFAALILAIDRKYVWIAPLGALAAFTRPGALALAGALAVIFIVRMLRRRTDPFPPAQVLGLMFSGLVTAAAGSAWSVIAEKVTGVPNAYIRTELGWWLGAVGNDPFVPFTPWFRQAGTHLGVFGVVLVIALMVGFVLLMWSRPVRRLGLVVVSYTLMYGLYLFAVFLPQNSTFRLMVPLSPLLGDDRFSSTPRRRNGILIGCIVLQVVSVWTLWAINHP